MPSEPLLRVKNLSRIILRNISLDLHEGELLALVGPSGSGKSTLISHSPRVLAAVAASVLIMRAGRIVERGAPREVLAHAL